MSKETFLIYAVADMNEGKDTLMEFTGAIFNDKDSAIRYIQQKRGIVGREVELEECSQINTLRDTVSLTIARANDHEVRIIRSRG